MPSRSLCIAHQLGLENQGIPSHTAQNSVVCNRRTALHKTMLKQRNILAGRISEHNTISTNFATLLKIDIAL